MTMKQLLNRRLVHRIPQSAMAERMNCTHQWVSIIEGMVTGTTAEKWGDRYEEALKQIIEERRAGK